MQQKRFQVYQSHNKRINNTFQLQTLTKKNIKTLKTLECEEGYTGSENFTNSKITEGPRLANLVKKNKFLSSFRSSNYSKTTQKCLPILLALKNLHSLSRFRLEFYSEQTFKPKISQAFTLCTKSLKKLANLDFISSKSVLNPVESFQTLHFIAPLTLLSHLSLDFYCSLWLTDRSWSTFSYHLPSLTSLSLNLNCIENLTQTSLRTIFSCLSKLHLLTSFDFSIGGSESLDFATFIFLFENLKNLSHFQDLTLSLGSCSHLKLDDQDPLAIGLALLNLRKLSLGFYPNFSDSDLSELFTVIQKFSALENLHLSFSHLDQITTEGLTGLPAALAQFPALQSLNLSINRAIETEFFFKAISLGLKDLKELVSLTLDTWSAKTIDNLGVQQLLSQLPDLPKLQHLNLTLGTHSQLDIQTIGSISQTLPKLTGLRSFGLDCCAADKNDANIFDDLIRNIGCLTNLRKLSLSFGSSFDLTAETLENMRTSLKSLDYLAELSLTFDMCCMKDEVGEALKNLIQALESQERLSEIYIVMPSPWEEDGFKEDQAFIELKKRVENGPKKFYLYHS